MELLALGLVTGVLVWALVAFGKKSNKLEVSENEVEILKKQRDNDVTNVDDARRVLKRFKRK